LCILIMTLFLFLLSVFRVHFDRLSFPTRRSSDLQLTGEGVTVVDGVAVGGPFISKLTTMSVSNDGTLFYGGAEINVPSFETDMRSEEHTSEIQPLTYFVCHPLLNKINKDDTHYRL